MINGDYNEKFRLFFKKFEKRYFSLDEEQDREFLWDLAVDFVEKNRDFVMQYPLVQYWKDVDRSDYECASKRLLEKYNDQSVNLYFHIPFCKTRCTYCNFHIVVWDKSKSLQETMYIHKLKREIDDFLTHHTRLNIDTIFIGGWTPSYLSPEAMESLLSYIREKLSRFFSKNMEYTFEWNPDSFSEQKLRILKKYDINRLSFWVQTFRNSILKGINRTYDESVVYDILDTARKCWFENINIDMIYGLPGSDYRSMKEDLVKVSRLEVSHITYYPLYYYDESILSVTWKREDNVREIYRFYDEVVSVLRERWFGQYGREYFCKGTAIHHYQNNFVSNKLLYGFGSSAYSFNGTEAFYKSKNLSDYLKRDDVLIKEFVYDDKNSDRRLFVLGSRNREIRKVNIKNIEEARKNLTLPIRLGLVSEDANAFRLTEKGLKYQEVLAHMVV